MPTDLSRIDTTNMASAMFNWLAENFVRVHVAFATDHPGVVIPSSVQRSPGSAAKWVLDSDSGQVTPPIAVETITLNFGEDATSNRDRSSEGFSAKVGFAGKVEEVFIPMDAVIAVYSHAGNSSYSAPNYGKGFELHLIRTTLTKLLCVRPMNPNPNIPLSQR